jgi:hypothetical protein
MMMEYQPLSIRACRQEIIRTHLSKGYLWVVLEDGGVIVGNLMGMLMISSLHITRRLSYYEIQKSLRPSTDA